jgi:hypothetical protein
VLRAGWRVRPIGNIRKERHALITVNRSDVARYREYWEAQLVVKPFSKYDLELRQGDLILYLIDLKTHKRVLVRPLRRLP